ncbi:MAG: glycosyltransferase family 1 protein [Cytophagales bacterium]|nr:MAG: glycosyltransferase family 1 protein [Cytophagales bacterium]
MDTSGVHIIAFDVPYPADYGGVIDIFYKIKCLSEKGIKIHLHVFEYGRKPSKELEVICEKVYYYKRKGWSALFSIRPYIIESRGNWELLANLRKNKWSILFEGLHTCYFLHHKELAQRNKLVRLHNIEHHYYQQLSDNEKNIFKKIYYLIESKKLEWFQIILAKANHLLAISDKDFEYFKLKFPNQSTDKLQPWLAYNKVNIQKGKGSYILYHANLSVAENENAVLLLIKNVFSKINTPFIIAGKNPSKKIYEAVKSQPHGKLIGNPDENNLSELISNAHIHLLYSLQNTGIKLRLFNALYNGKFCIANNRILEGTSLEKLCQVCNSYEEIISTIQSLLNKDFDEEEINKRKNFFSLNFNNESNTNKLIEILRQ